MSKKKLYLVFAITLLIAAVGFLGYKRLMPQKILSSQVARQKPFPALRPTGYEVERESVKYDPESKVLAIKVVSKNGYSLAINQQEVPDLVAEDNYFEALLQRLKVYHSFPSKQGRVHLTRPAEFKGGQSAVLRTDTTLMFVRPSRDLSPDEWREVFSDLVEVK